MVCVIEERDGCKTETLKPLFPDLDGCGFKLIGNHLGLRSFLRERELTWKEMVEERNEAFLQKNCVFFFCGYQPKMKKNNTSGEMVPEHELSETAIGKTLQLKINDATRFFTVRIPVEMLEERDVRTLPITVRKDISYVDSHSGKEMGWYNIRANILWLSDIAHYDYRVIQLMKPIIASIKELRTKATVSVTDSLKIGADPEFEIVDAQGSLIPAHDFWEMNGDIGTDGHSSTGELRPVAEDTPLRLVRNIRRLMRRIANHPKMPDNIKIQAGGGTKVTTGGHIHFSLTKLTPQMTDALYDLVAVPMLKGMTGPRAQAKSTITKGGSDTVRSQPHGLEWRVLPSWLTGEDVCAAVLCTVYTIVKACLSGTFQMKSKVDTTLRGLPRYETYREYIEIFIEKFVKETTKLEGVDAMNNWNVERIYRKFTVRILSKNHDIQAFFKPIPAKIKKSVRIKIDYGTNYLLTEKLPKEMVPKFAEFAEKHFVEYENKIKVNQSNGDSDEPKYGDYISCAIYLPEAWSRLKKKSTLLGELRGLVQETATISGGRC